MKNAFLKSFSTLKNVYSEKSFSSITLNKTLQCCRLQDKALITKIVYGVLENDIKLSYIISKYVKKTHNDDTFIILKMGTFILAELSLPAYAVVNDLAELTKITGDMRKVGFVNATLKNISKSIMQFDDWPVDDILNISVRYSYPEWAVRKLIKDYGKDTMKQIVSCKSLKSNIVRLKNGGISLAKTLFDNFEQTCFPDVFMVCGGNVSLNENVTIQSLGSVAISRAAANLAKRNLLDCCSAPGGKAVYIKQLRPEVEVTACDIYSHRVELIKAYAARMNTEIETYCADMSVYNSEWEKKFDTVLCDVPCSGFGVLDSKPDIKLFRENKDISELMKIQYAILSNCCNYVSDGGSLIYSTCTIFDNENGQIIRKFLKEHDEFTYGVVSVEQLPQTRGLSCYQFLPFKDAGMPGFYIAVLQRRS